MTSSPVSPASSTPSASRRQVLARTGALGVGIAFAGSLSEIFAGTAAARGLGRSGYGPLVPDPAGLLDLPEGFRYKVLSREGGPLRSGEGRVPSNHDGMSAFRGHRGRVHLVRNHENRHTARIGVPTVEGLTYDPAAKGGCTVLALDGRNNVLDERVGIAGTAVNCAGGPTPWNTWLTCEENEDKAGTNGYTKDHGFIFEVDPADPHRTGAVPLTAMGRFQHEAIAVDPKSGIVYETEDAFDRPFGLFYRFLPEKPLGGTGSLRAGGALEAMRRFRACPTCRRSRRPARVSAASNGCPYRTRWPGGRRSGSRTSGGRASRTPRSWRAATGATRRSTSSPASRAARRGRRRTTSGRCGSTSPRSGASPWSWSSARVRTSSCPASPPTTSASRPAAA